MKRNKHIQVYSAIFAIMISFILFVFAFQGIVSVFYNNSLKAKAEESTFKAPTTLKELQNSNPQDVAKMSVYDGRNFDIVTDVKNQESNPICWAFASSAATATNILRQGITTDKKKVNFNEKNIAYSVFNRDSDPLNNTFESVSSGVPWNDAHNDSDLPRLFTQWRGLIDSNEPYKYAGYEKNLYKLKNTIVMEGNRKTITNEEMKLAIATYGAVTIGIKAPTGSYYQYWNTTSTGINHGVTIVGWDDTIEASYFPSGAKPSRNGGWIIKNSWGSSAHRDGYYYMSYDCYFSTPVIFEWTTNDIWDNNYFYDADAAPRENQYRPDEGQNYVAMANNFEVKKSTSTQKEFVKSVNVEIKGYDVTCEVGIYTGLSSLTSAPTSGTLAGSTKQTFHYPGNYTIDLPELVELQAGTTFSVVVKVSNKDNTARITCEVDNSSMYDFTFDWRSGVNQWKRTKTEDTESTARIKAYTVNKSRTSPDMNNLAYAECTFKDSNICYYNGQEQTPKVTVQLNGKELVEDVDYTLTYKDNIESGAGIVEIQGKGAYHGKRSNNFDIRRSEYPPNLPGEAISANNITRRTMTVDGSVRYLHEITLPTGWHWVEAKNNQIVELQTGKNTDKHVEYYDTNTNHYRRTMFPVVITKTTETTPKTSIDGATVTVSADSFVYNSKEHRPNVQSVILNSVTLTENTDYSVSYENNINAGTAKVIVAGMGKYSGRVEKTFNITKADSPTFNENQMNLQPEQQAKYLNNIPLPNGWQWQNGDTLIRELKEKGDTTEQTIIYVGADKENYTNCQRVVQLNLSKVEVNENLQPTPPANDIINSNKPNSTNKKNSNVMLWVGIAVGGAIVVSVILLIVVLKR